MTDIILTAEEAEEARQLKTETAALNPIRLPSGEYALPGAVLTDPAYVFCRALLKGKPRRVVRADEWQPKSSLSVIGK